MRTTFFAACFILPVKVFFTFEPAAVLDFLALEMVIRALTGAFVVAGLRGDFTSVFLGDFLGEERPVPLARARIFFLVSGDGRLSDDDPLTDEAVVAFAAFAFDRGPFRTAALTLDAALTLGNFTFFAAFPRLAAAEALVVF